MAKLIDGRIHALAIRERVKKEITIQGQKGQRPPCLAVILVGEDPASEIYVERKKATCDLLGIVSKTFKLPSSLSQAKLYSLIEELNGDASVDGILLQLPLPPHLDKIASLAAICRTKMWMGLVPAMKVV